MAGRRKRVDSQFVDASRRLARLLADSRRAHGLTQEQLAAQAKISLSTLRKIETNRTVEPGYFTVTAIATTLDVNLMEASRSPRGSRSTRLRQAGEQNA